MGMSQNSAYSFVARTLPMTKKRAIKTIFINEIERKKKTHQEIESGMKPSMTPPKSSEG